MELINLHLYDHDRERGTLMVRLGKGKKDRMVPIGQRAIDWCDNYLLETRPQIYTSVSIRRLKAVHDLTHPAKVNKLKTTTTTDKSPEPD